MEICENADKGVPGNIYPTRNMDDEESSDLYSALTRTNACGLQYATLRQTTVAVRFDPTALVDDMLLLPVAILITYTFLIRLQI